MHSAGILFGGLGVCLICFAVLSCRDFEIQPSTCHKGSVPYSCGKLQFEGLRASLIYFSLHFCTSDDVGGGSGGGGGGVCVCVLVCLTHTHACTHTLSHTDTDRQTDRHTHTPSLSLSHTHTRTYAHTHTHTHTRTHTHTHTHTLSLSPTHFGQEAHCEERQMECYFLNRTFVIQIRVVLATECRHCCNNVYFQGYLESQKHGLPLPDVSKDICRRVVQHTNVIPKVSGTSTPFAGP